MAKYPIVPKLMATKAGTKTPEFAAPSVLEQLAAIDAGSLSPETARKVLEFHLADSHYDRVKALSRKAQTGPLLPAEQTELDEYIRVGTLLSILQSRARQALKRSGHAL